jgi:hypothetical protein
MLLQRRVLAHPAIRAIRQLAADDRKALAAYLETL